MQKNQILIHKGKVLKNGYSNLCEAQHALIRHCHMSGSYHRTSSYHMPNSYHMPGSTIRPQSLALKAVWRSFPGITSNIVFPSGTTNSLFSDEKSGPYFLNYIQEGPENKTKQNRGACPRKQPSRLSPVSLDTYRSLLFGIV